MKVIIAMDSFKGSMTSLEAGNAAKKGVLRAMPDVDIVVKPLADGGEGTVAALIEGLRGEEIEIVVSDPLGRPTKSYYGFLPDGTAVMEMAQAAGITKLTEEECNPLVTSTYGVGEMIADAIERGCRKFVIGIGGSATNDGGVGMLEALGYEFLDHCGKKVKAGAGNLSRIVEIRCDKVLPQLQECDFYIACDVDNPLCGTTGATFVYGPQKGLPMELCQRVDEGMLHYAQLAECFVEKCCLEEPGAGAAGGLGFAFITFLQGKLVSGVDLILDTIYIEKDLKSADIVITGEGRLDGQTARGKAPVGVARRAKKYGCKVLVFAGCIGEGAQQCLREGVDAFYGITDDGFSLEEQMKKENAMSNMENTVEDVFRKSLLEGNRR